VPKKSGLQDAKRSRSGGYGEHLQRGRRDFLGTIRWAWRSHAAPHRNRKQVLCSGTSRFFRVCPMHCTQKRRLLRAALAAATALTLAACARENSVRFHGVDVTGAEYAQDIALHDADGQPRSLRDFAGKVVVVFFGYVQCPDFCPLTLQEMAEVKHLLGADGERLQVVFVTVDPERDTPEILKAYVSAFDASFVGLHGSAEEIAAVAKDFKVYYNKVPGKTEGNYTVDHSAGSYVFDPAGRLRLYQRYGTPAQALAEDVRALLNPA